MNQLSNFDIENIINKLGFNNIFNGCFLKDNIHELKTGFYIINLQSSKNGNGTHWCSLYVINPNYSIWFDSFGFPPPIEIEKLLKKYNYNKMGIQNIDASTCGYYCIAFIKFMHGQSNPLKSLETFIKIFKPNTIYNDRILKTLLY